jgi:DNA-binding transcriptional LysR family regulator
VARLEKSLDTRLLHRTTRVVSLTEPGQAFYNEVRNLLEALEASKKTAKSFTQEVTGTLKIGLAASICYLHLTPKLHLFTQKFPQLKIQIVNGNHLLDLLREGFDLIIHCNTLPDSNYYYQKLGNWRKIICTSPSYLKKFGTPKTPQDLTAHHCLDHYDNFQRTWKFNVNNKVMLIPINSIISANSSMDLKNLAIHGQGIAYLPSFTVFHELKAGRLISILEDYQPHSIGMFAVYPSHQYLSKKSKLFLDFLSQLLAPVLAL